jgi:outer membrane murein-binding lipoprotein Lpp
MTTAEEKLDLLLTEVKALQAGQLKLANTVDAINTWSIAADKIAANLNKSIINLTSHMKALEEATSASPPPAPPREEEGVGQRPPRCTNSPGCR